MGNKMDLEVAQKLSDVMAKTASTMENELNNIQNDFKALGNTFKDSGYTSYQTELNAADKTMTTIIADLNSLKDALIDYKNAMGELL